jgi:hypothetical protein
MDDDPTKTHSQALREHHDNIARMNDGRRGGQLHEAAHTGVGIIEAVSAPIHVEDPYTPLHRADEIAAVILKLVTVLALTFGLFEYDRQKADARVTESLSLVQEWETGGYQDAYERINELLLPIYQQSAEAIAAVGDEAAAKALLYGNIGEAITGKDDSFVSQPDRDVDKVFHFFERAAICANEAICDYPVLKTFFGSEASSFWLYFGKYAERRQADGYAGYGDWTQKFVTGEIERAKFLGAF